MTASSRHRDALQIFTVFSRKSITRLAFFRKGTEVVMKSETTIFYVDDNPKSSRLLTSVLEECGFRVITKNDPIEALELCTRLYFDLALLDYEMPLMTGARLAEEIKYLVPDVPVVLISGRSSLPPSELVFVDAHFGFGTALDDLLWTMRILSHPKAPAPCHPIDHRADPRAMTQWADST
jgi:CheY-like chemotaxis protein